MTKYAKPREVPNAHIQYIMGLSVITETNPTRINEFYAHVALISKMNRNPDRRECKRIEMIMTWKGQKIEMYKSLTLKGF